MELKFFTTIGKGHGAPCYPASSEDWNKMRQEAWLAELCARIENGEEELKHTLPVWTPHCAEFRGNHRAIADAVKPLNRLMLDFDEKGHTDEIVARLMQKSPLTVLLIEESVRRGTHVLVELPEGMTAAQAQALMKEATGFTPDASVKDVSRCIYMVTEAHTRYVSPKLFEVTEEAEQKNQPTSTESKFGLSEAQEEGERKSASVGNEEGTSSVKPNSEKTQRDECEEEDTLSFKGVPYDEIINEYWLRNGGIPSKGERNVKLHKLAVNLRSICDNQKEVLQKIMPRFGLTEAEMTSIIDSACKEAPKGISKQMKDIVEALELGVTLEELEDAEAVENQTGVKLKRRSLPIGLKESLVGVPINQQMPVLCSIMPIAGAYADQVEVEYCDGNMQHLGLMSIIYGEQASGKSVCKNVINVWKRPMDEEDALSRKVEDEWKEAKKSRKANEKAPDDPHVVIRGVPITISNSTLLKRLKNANGHCLYSFCEELDTLRKTNGAGSWSSKYDIYRVAFDRSEWGQDYNSDQAESGVVKVGYNYTILGTKGSLEKCFKSDNIENGLSSRILVSSMPDASFSKMPKYGKRSAEDEARILEATKMLRSRSGVIEVPRLRKATEQWVEQKRVEAAKDIDYVKDIYRKRAAVIGFRCGVIFHILSGKEKESKACIEFALMMAEYCLSEQIKAFGNSLKHQYVEAKVECQRYGANSSVFDQLPAIFTKEDLRGKKEGFCAESSLYTIISRWRRDGWIEKTDASHWKKTLQSNNPTTLQ